LIEETGWRVYYFDSQAFALSFPNMESFEFAALYTLPHRLPRVPSRLMASKTGT
jgi:hypothetical protein